MRKWITLLMTLLVGSGVSYANANTGQVSLEVGYRNDDISWKHRVPADSPIVSSDTKFKNIDIFQIGLKGRTTVGYNFYLRANAYWGWVLDGDYERSISTYFSPYSDYFDQNFEFEFNNDRHNIIDDKYVYGIGGAIGYPFYFCDCTLVLAPVIGYSFDEQNICLEDEGFDYTETAGLFVPVSGSHCCCHKFINRWYGPFVGVDFTYRPYNECWNLYAELEFHWGSFRGKKHFNEGFNFFDRHDHHRSNNARGWVLAVGADYDVWNCWTIGLSVKFQDWRAHRRHSHDDSCTNYDSYFVSSGDYIDHERNIHRWHSYAINLTIGREF